MTRTNGTPVGELTVTFDEITDPEELARSRARRERFARNLAWFEAHALEIGQQHRGRCICIAGEELFAADTAEGVLAQARAAHPEDDGFFLHYIPVTRGPKVYAHRRPLAAM
jgi:hypothetical protein